MDLVEGTDRLPSTLAEHEAVIQQGLASFVMVGNALTAIKIGKLYKQAGFDTFDQYMRERWHVAKSQGYRLMIAASTHEALAHELETSPLGDIPLPESERQIRPLASVPDDKKLEAWQAAVEAADGEQPTAAQVEHAVATILPPKDATHQGAPDEASTAAAAVPVTAISGGDIPGSDDVEGAPADLSVSLPGPTISENVLSAIGSVYRGLLNRYPADFLAGELDHDVVESVESLARSLNQWAVAIRDSHPRNLRAVQGGRP